MKFIEERTEFSNGIGITNLNRVFKKFFSAKVFSIVIDIKILISFFQISNRIYHGIILESNKDFHYSNNIILFEKLRIFHFSQVRSKKFYILWRPLYFY
jgi:hypothetical protein